MLQVRYAPWSFWSRVGFPAINPFARRFSPCFFLIPLLNSRGVFFAFRADGWWATDIPCCVSSAAAVFFFFCAGCAGERTRAVAFAFCSLSLSMCVCSPHVQKYSFIIVACAGERTCGLDFLFASGVQASGGPFFVACAGLRWRTDVSSRFPVLLCVVLMAESPHVPSVCFAKLSLLVPPVIPEAVFIFFFLFFYCSVSRACRPSSQSRVHPRCCQRACPRTSVPPRCSGSTVACGAILLIVCEFVVRKLYLLFALGVSQGFLCGRAAFLGFVFLFFAFWRDLVWLKSSDQLLVG